jgi:hypothetical protein
MGNRQSLLEGLCEHAQSLGATFIEVERRDGSEWILAGTGPTCFRIAHYEAGGSDAEELLDNLSVARKKMLRAVLNGRVFLLKTTVEELFGEDAFRVEIEPAPGIDPSAPSFTAKQGQYLTYIYNYCKMHREAPSEADLQRYFQVSPPSVHEMIKTLQRNGLIEKIPGKARSIRVLVPPEQLPKLQ